MTSTDKRRERRRQRRATQVYDAATIQRQQERQAELLAGLRSVFPEHERVLTGWDAIIGYLCDTMRLRRLNGERLTVPQLRRWQLSHRLPVLRGGALVRVRRGYQRTLPTSTNFLLSSWLVSVPRCAGLLFTVAYPPREHSARGDRRTEGAPSDLPPPSTCA